MFGAKVAIFAANRIDLAVCKARENVILNLAKTAPEMGRQSTRKRLLTQSEIHLAGGFECPTQCGATFYGNPLTDP